MKLKKFTDYCPISQYHPQIIKSGIPHFSGSKYYIDTSSVEGINNILCNEEITYEKRPSRANMMPTAGSVWFAKMKSSNKIMIVTKDDSDILDDKIFSTGFIGIRGTDELPLSLLSAFVLSTDFMKLRDQNSVGTTMEGINNDTFLKIDVPYLSKMEVLKFESMIGPLINELSILRRKITILKAEKELLLKKYF